MNNFDIVRITLALVVLLSHVSVLTQSPELQWLHAVFDSNFAVRSFFVISGFLICRSYINSVNLKDYIEKRIRRIYPAYALTIIACTFIGLAVTTVPAKTFVLSTETFQYIIANLLLLNFLQPTLPGVFTDHYIPALNGSLWTIKIEVALYALLPLFLYLIRRFGTIVGGALILAPSLSWTFYFSCISENASAAEMARQVPGQIPYFLAGMIHSIHRPQRKVLLAMTLISFASLSINANPVYRAIIDPIAYSSIIIFACTAATKSIGVSKFGDLSYGIYLFHFPIIQALVELQVFKTHPWISTATAIGATFICASLSWKFIENPFLQQRRRSKPEHLNQAHQLDKGA